MNTSATTEPARITTGWRELTVAGEASPMSAYAAAPALGRPRSGVVVAGEVFGLTRHARSVADRLAGLGFAAIVPDLYHRQGRRIALPDGDAGRSRGLELLNTLRREEALRDVRAAVAQLREESGGTGGAAMLGLSSGGHLACYAASQIPLAAVVAFYPGWLTGGGIPLSRPEPTLSLAPAIAALGTRVLIHAGDRDHLVPPSEQQEIARGLRRAGVSYELAVYPGAPHGFFCEERDTYRPLAAAEAWARTIRLLDLTCG